MTTIAFKDDIMAADSRCTNDDGTFATRMQKIYRLENKALFGIAGDADAREVMMLLGKATSKRMPSKAELAATKTDIGGLIVFPNGTIYFIDIQPNEPSPEWHASIVECKERFTACGSGQNFAIGAMAAGRTAKQAVEIACRYDTASGPPVVEMSLKPEPKAKRVRKAHA